MLTAGGNRQSLLIEGAAYPNQGGVSFLTAPSDKQLLVHSYSVTNNDSSAKDLGLGVGFCSIYGVKLFTKAAANTDVTSSASMNLFDTTNNHGYYLQCRRKFGYFAFNVTQAQTGSPVYVYEYWDGSTWQTLTPTNSPDMSGTGIKCLTFNPPLDWAAGSNSEIPAFSVATDGYTIRARASTAPSQAVVVSGMKVAYWIAFRKNVQAYQQLSVAFLERGFLMENGEYLMPFCGSAIASNTVEAAYQVHG